MFDVAFCSTSILLCSNPVWNNENLRNLCPHTPPPLPSWRLNRFLFGILDPPMIRYSCSPKLKWYRCHAVKKKCPSSLNFAFSHSSKDMTLATPLGIVVKTCSHMYVRPIIPCHAKKIKRRKGRVYVCYNHYKPYEVVPRYNLYAEGKRKIFSAILNGHCQLILINDPT